MKPPTCYFCGADDDEGSALVKFSDYTPLPQGMVGHPHGLEWFCNQHLPLAQQLSYLPAAKAKTIAISAIAKGISHL